MLDMQDWLSPTGINKCWKSPSQADIRRDYDAAAVLALRDIYPEAINGPAHKLRRILAKHQAAQSINLTCSAMDATSLQMMREAGLGQLQLVTLTLADYTYDTVPKRVATLHRSQLLHIRTNPKSSDPEEGIVPIIADADSGHGLHTANMKLVKLFVQAGAAGIYIDDLLSGAKRFDGKGGYVLVPLNEHIRRIKAARLMLDIMGSEMVLIGRHDGNSATHITSTIDPRDRPFILGVSRRSSKLLTLDEAFKREFPAFYLKFIHFSSEVTVSAALEIAQQLAPTFHWSCESVRTPEGWYRYKGGSEATISRALVVASLVDVSWACMGTYDAQQAVDYAHAIQSAFPGKWMAYNFTGAFGASGPSDEEISLIPEHLAKLGYVWQFLPVAGMTAIGVGTKPIFRAIKQDGVLGYLRSASKPAAEGTAPSVEWWWKSMGRLSDAAADIIGDGL